MTNLNETIRTVAIDTCEIVIELSFEKFNVNGSVLNTVINEVVKSKNLTFENGLARVQFSGLVQSWISRNMTALYREIYPIEEYS